MGGDRRRGRGSFGMNLGRPIIITRDGEALFPNEFWGGLIVITESLSINIASLSAEV